MESRLPNQIAWIVAADMGLGHQRAAFPLQSLGGGRVITAGAPEFSSLKENQLWRRMRNAYEGISRINRLPVVGGFFFNLMDRIQEISPYYPFRDLSHATLQVKYLSSLVRKGLGATLLDIIAPSGLPMVSTFFATAMAANHRQYPNYLVVTDTDINRVWVAENPLQSNIRYCVPCRRALRRLKEYGVPDSHIYLTGFPLPKENLGSPDLEVLKLDLAQRMIYLDPKRHFWDLHRVEAEYYLSAENCVKRSNRILTLTFAVGGAGAQKEIGRDILKSLKKRILDRQIRLNLVAGIRPEVQQYFAACIKELDLEDQKGLGVNILSAPNLEKYFQRFNRVLRTTDILWTKPSELSFYSGLGIPIIMGPPLGSQEHYNTKWLMEIRAGIPQEDPSLCAEWLFDLLNEGRLAQSAWDGFLNARKCGTYKIEEILRNGDMSRDPSPLKR